MSGETVLIAKSGGVTRLTLNRPDKLNAFTTAMHAELRAGLEARPAIAQCRVVVLTGAGRAFCAGQDLAETASCRTDGVVPDGGSRLEKAYNPLIRLITTLEKPVICAVNGIAAGAGANIALACDIVYRRAQRELPAGLRQDRPRPRRRRHLGAAAPRRRRRAPAGSPCWPSRSPPRRPRPGA